MRKSVVALVFLVLVVLGLSLSAGNGVQINGTLGASEQEAGEGYFAVSQDTMIMVKPGSATHEWLKSHIGQRVVLTVEPDPATE